MPTIINRSLCKYEDKRYSRSIGRLSYSASLRMAIAQISDRELAPTVQRSVDVLVHRARMAAPIDTGALRSGIIRSPGPERSSKTGKVVYDLYMDPGMNDTFVKYTKAGKRYYYPSSMEYGFRLQRGGRYSGKYFLRDSAIAYAAEHAGRVVQLVENLIDDL